MGGVGNVGLKNFCVSDVSQNIGVDGVCSVGP